MDWRFIGLTILFCLWVLVVGNLYVWLFFTFLAPILDLIRLTFNVTHNGDNQFNRRQKSIDSENNRNPWGHRIKEVLHYIHSGDIRNEYTKSNNTKYREDLKKGLPRVFKILDWFYMNYHARILSRVKIWLSTTTHKNR